ncbi:hypothetical protein FOMPIDRAFT_1024523 [Fomitopsis schrenkii]|uniref:MYND-type domain-containing protein n=1 Tax=Fomitopsis schrenkii TaxID=2126942 RepID=S8E602_FOMSC|nr:hypothetical protein FOMPIDRAFT_1024523 [Fomitopsis schrenkii]
MVAHCAKCPKRVTHRCKACRVTTAHYCSKECQRLDWPEHKWECDSKASSQPDEADKLVRAAHRLCLPHAMVQLEEFGFVRAAMVDNISELFGFWVDFITSLEVSSRSIRNWRRDGVLASSIDVGYQNTGRKRRESEGYQWFQEHAWIIDPSHGVPRSLINAPRARETAFRQWLGYPDAMFRNIRTVMKTWPRTKVACYEMCEHIFNHWALLPPSGLWQDFGFCVCRHYREEKLLEDIYKRVFELHTFEEFWTACDKGSLMTLLEPILSAYGWRIRRHAELQDVLRYPPMSDKTTPVWTLKGFLMSDYEGVIRNAPSESIWAEFGFPNARSLADIMELRRLYRTLLFDKRVRPLELQNAATNGDLYDFCESILGFRKAQRELFGRLLGRDVEAIASSF